MIDYYNWWASLRVVINSIQLNDYRDNRYKVTNYAIDLIDTNISLDNPLTIIHNYLQINETTDIHIAIRTHTKNTSYLSYSDWYIWTIKTRTSRKRNPPNFPSKLQHSADLISRIKIIRDHRGISGGHIGSYLSRPHLFLYISVMSSSEVNSPGFWPFFALYSFYCLFPSALRSA